MIPAEHVWALAVTADRINSGYVKYDQRSADGLMVLREANKMMVRRWIREQYSPETTAEDIEEGRQVRDHYKSYMLLMLAGRCTEFQRQALKISQMDEFTDRNTLEFAIISCLPDVRRRDLRDREFTAQLRDSEPLPLGEKQRIAGRIQVLECRYSSNYDRYFVKARLEHQEQQNFVMFFCNNELPLDSQHEIKARVKRHNPDKSVWLNYVSITG
jgi:hypothetical protein